MTHTLSQTQGWDVMNAYARAKLCCAEFTRQGEAIPSWTTIRDIIGKGSSGDINRAKKDYRVEHAEALRRMEGFAHEGIPENLTPLIVGFWQEAVGHAKQSFAEQTRAWSDEIEQAHAAAQLAATERDRALTDAQTLRATVAGLEEARNALQGQVLSEQAARAQAEKMASETHEALVDQRERLDKALAEAKIELEKAIARLEGAERRSMMEIERIRQEASRQVSDGNARLKSEQDRYTIDMSKLSKQLQEATIHTASVQDRNQTLEKEIQALRVQLQGARDASAELRQQNTELLTAVAQPTGARGSGARRLARGRTVLSKRRGLPATINRTPHKD
ncbi:DNA-binding protein [Castellaniella sp.]|uniref:DNA-binding protein n=1 Tax=Castellaniella sp. TaxID=1955812 RepID=UPI002AFE47CA|nr:DNA-binding protein [Castellaniella sp.]